MGGGFDHAKFIEWAATSEHPVFVSEYNIDDKRMRVIKSISKRSMLCAEKDKKKTMSEKIYANRAALSLISAPA